LAIEQELNSQSSEQASKEASKLATNTFINQSINQSIDQSVNQSINQSTNQSINQSIGKSVCQSIVCLLDKTARVYNSSFNIVWQNGPRRKGESEICRNVYPLALTESGCINSSASVKEPLQ